MTSAPATLTRRQTTVAISGLMTGMLLAENLEHALATLTATGRGALAGVDARTLMANAERIKTLPIDLQDSVLEGFAGAFQAVFLVAVLITLVGTVVALFVAQRPRQRGATKGLFREAVQTPPSRPLAGTIDLLKFTDLCAPVNKNGEDPGARVETPTRCISRAIAGDSLVSSGRGARPGTHHDDRDHDPPVVVRSALRRSSSVSGSRQSTVRKREVMIRSDDRVRPTPEGVIRAMVRC